VRILLVSDLDHFATRNVFEDYLIAFKKAGVDVHPFRMWEITKTLSMKVMYSLLFSDIMIKSNGITHVLFVTGTNVPKDIVESLRDDIKVGVIGTDDPHSSKYVMDVFNNKLDYYFTNEKKMDRYDERFHYVPIGTSSRIPTEISDKHLSDLCFIGSVYPNRIPMLERAVHWALKNGKKPLVLGPLNAVPEGSIIRSIGIDTIVNNIQAMQYMAGARVSINMDRDVHWNPQAAEGNHMLLDVGEPLSCNPRTYEIPLNRSIQLYINHRKEAVDIFGDSIFTADESNLEEVLQTIFDSTSHHLEELKNRAYNIALNHTYDKRVTKILEVITKG